MFSPPWPSSPYTKSEQLRPPMPLSSPPHRRLLSAPGRLEYTQFIPPPALSLSGAPSLSAGPSSSGVSSSLGLPPSMPTQLPNELALMTWAEAMEECRKEGEAKEEKEKAQVEDKGKGKALVISGGEANRQIEPPSLRHWLLKPVEIKDVLDRIITDPNNVNGYKAIKIIGNSAGDALVFKSYFLGFTSYPTYDGIRIRDFVFGLKVIDTNRQEEYQKLVEQVERNLIIDHPNILGIKDRIEFEDHFFCVSFPKMKNSLRSLLDTTFLDGFPRVLIAIALKEVLQALVYLHQQGVCHQELNAGHVYFRRHDPAIKIGFLATLYEDIAKDPGRNQNLQSGNLPRETICEWGAAPEIYHLKKEYTEKSDIWLVGITAMELAYVGFPVQDRQQLEIMIKSNLMVTVRDQRGDEKKKSAVVKQLDKVKKKLGKIKASSIPNAKPVGVLFKEMLTLCLKESPEERPTAEVLLQHDFFQIWDDTFNLKYFMKAVLEEIEKRK